MQKIRASCHGAAAELSLSGLSLRYAMVELTPASANRSGPIERMKKR